MGPLIWRFGQFPYAKNWDVIPAIAMWSWNPGRVSYAKLMPGPLPQPDQRLHQGQSLEAPGGSFGTISDRAERGWKIVTSIWGIKRSLWRSWMVYYMYYTLITVLWCIMHCKWYTVRKRAIRFTYNSQYWLYDFSTPWNLWKLDVDGRCWLLWWLWWCWFHFGRRHRVLEMIAGRCLDGTSNSNKNRSLVEELRLMNDSSPWYFLKTWCKLSTIQCL